MIHGLLQLFIYLIIADIILSYVPQARGQKWAQMIHKIADAPQRPIREMLPQGLPIDFSPMIVIILVQMLMFVLR
jgi:YggT family protein